MIDYMRLKGWDNHNKSNNTDEARQRNKEEQGTKKLREDEIYSFGLALTSSAFLPSTEGFLGH